MYFIRSFFYKILMEYLLCTRHCAKVWGVLIWFHGKQTLRWWLVSKQFVGEALRKNIYERVRDRDGQKTRWAVVWLQMKTCLIAQRLEVLGESSELSWIEAMRSGLCMFTLTSYCMSMNASQLCKIPEKRLSCGLTAASNPSS